MENYSNKKEEGNEMKYWVKIHHEVLQDLKMAKLPDTIWRRCMEMFLFAGQNQDDGVLPDVDEMAWILHIETDTLLEQLEELKKVGILSSRMKELTNKNEGANSEEWVVTNFTKWQSSMTKAEYMQKKRKSEKAETHSVLHETAENDENEGANSEMLPIVTTPSRRREEKGREESISLFQKMRKEWASCFPEKPMPRTGNTTLQSKVKTRSKGKHFMENWERAMKIGSKSDFLNNGSFFDFGWFVSNDDNWEKVLNGNYTNDKGNGKAKSSGWKTAWITVKSFVTAYGTRDGEHNFGDAQIDNAIRRTAGSYVAFCRLSAKDQQYRFKDAYEETYR